MRRTLLTIAVSLLLITLCSFPVFANGDMDPNDRYNTYSLTEDLDKASDKEATIKDPALELARGSWVNIDGPLHDAIDGVYGVIVSCIDDFFPFTPSGNSSNMSITSNSNSTLVSNAVSFLIALMIILRVALMGVKTMMGTVNPRQEVINLSIKILVCFLLLRLCTYLPPAIIQLGNFLTGSLVKQDISKFTPSKAFIYPTHFARIATGFSTGLYGVSLLETSAGIVVANVGVSGTGLANVANVVTGLTAAIIGTSFTTSMMIMLWQIELYVMTIALYFYIPTMVFEGFTTDLKTIMKAFLMQGIKIALGKLLIIAVVEGFGKKSIYEQEGFMTHVIFLGCINLMRAIMCAMLVKTVPSILSSLMSGSPVSDGGASSTAGRALAATGIGSLAAGMQNSNKGVAKAHTASPFSAGGLGAKGAGGGGGGGADNAMASAVGKKNPYTGLKGIGQLAHDRLYAGHNPFGDQRSDSDPEKASVQEQRQQDAQQRLADGGSTKSFAVDHAGIKATKEKAESESRKQAQEAAAAAEQKAREEAAAQNAKNHNNYSDFLNNNYDGPTSGEDGQNYDDSASD